MQGRGRIEEVHELAAEKAHIPAVSGWQMVEHGSEVLDVPSRDYLRFRHFLYLLINKHYFYLFYIFIYIMSVVAVRYIAFRTI